MSLLDEVTTQQVVYGPDGKAYGNPAIARNAGVNQYYREDGTPYPVAIPAASGMGSGGPYSQIMGQMGGATPYERIMARMTPTMNPYTGAGVAIGGYDPALYRRMSGSGLINYGGGGGMGGGGGGYGGGGGLPSGPIAPTTPEEFAAQSARNQQLNDFLTGIAKNSFMGMALSGLNTIFGTQAPAPVDSLGTSLGGGFGSPAAQGQTSSQSGEGNPGESYGGFTSSDTGVGNPGESDSGGYGGYGGTSSDTGSGNPGESGSSDSSSSDSGGGDSGGGDGYAKGGKVTKSRLKGPDPKGPDEGYGALLSGEYVIKKSAVKKYGQGLLDMINDGKIPAKKMKSLLG